MNSSQHTITLASFIKKYLGKHSTAYSFMFGLIFFGKALNIFEPYLLKRIVDLASVVKEQNRWDELYWWIIAIIVCNFVLYFFWRTAGFIVAKTIPKSRKEIQEDMYKYLYNHSYNYFSNNFSGSLAQRITNTAQVFGSMLYTVGFDFYPSVLGFVFSIIALALTNILFAIVAVVWLAIFLIGFYVMAKKKSFYSGEASDASSGVGGRINDSIANMITVKTFIGFQYEKEFLKQHLIDEQSKGQKSWKYSEIINTIRSFAIVVFLIVMLGMAGYFWRQGLITAGDFVFIFTLTALIVDNTHYVFYEMINFFENLGAMKANINAIYTPHEIQDAKYAKKLLVKKGEITIENASFIYTNGSKVFNNLNIDIHFCEKIALVGKSGAGKTSLINLLLRFYELNDGRIYIDGQDIKNVQQESLRSSMAVVPQDPFLFHRSIMENIRYGNPKASDKEVIKAAKRAYADNFIATLPKGYDTIVGERGIKLSGGQRQRIAIARAILADRPILILDEATSSLDSESELYIQKALSELMKSRTVIAIAHRLSTIKQMDRILVMEDGKVIEEGQHSELLATEGAYSRLWNLQSGLIKD